MEITLESIIGIIGIFTGGGFGLLFYNYSKRQKKAEAVSAEASAMQAEAAAEQARVEANKQWQDMYQQMFEDIKKNYDEKQSIIEELRQDRDHYKRESKEQRERNEQLARSFMEWRLHADDDRSNMKMDIAKLGRKVAMMAPFMCGDLSCKIRQRIVLSEEGEIKPAQRTRKPAPKATEEKKLSDIEPINHDEL